MLNTSLKRQLLEGALKLLGPRGERWIKSEYREGQNYCLAGAVGMTATEIGVARYDDEDEMWYYDDVDFGDFGDMCDALTAEISLDALADSRGYSNVPYFNDSDNTEFRDIRELVAERLNQLNDEADA